MKIMNRITLRYLKESKKRTILTILCITFSVIMISCVGIGFSSVKDYYRQYIVKTDGDYHFAIVDDDTKTIDIIKNDKETKDYYFSRTTTNAYQETNINTKYGDQRYFEKKNLADYMLKGTLPQNKHQIVLSQRFLDTIKSDKTIGDTIELTDLDNETKITYSICGIMKYLPSDIFGQAMDAVSYIDLDNTENYYTMYVEEKTLSNDIFDHVNGLEKEIAKAKNISLEEFYDDSYLSYNSGYLGLNSVFESNSDSNFYTAYRLGGFVLGIIVFVSIFIIYQAFNLSTFERISYLGMLSSVGATRKQKMRSVYFEGLILSVIGIPLGILCSFIGLATAFHFINQFDLLKNLGISIHTTIEPLYLLGVIVLSLLTIFISLYLPARKVSRISVIDALKNKDDVKVKAKKLKTHFFSRDIYKQLAVKNYKRQGKRSRVIVFSLSISIIAFISVYSFGKNMLQVSDNANDTSPYDVEVYTSSSSNVEKIDNYLKHNGSVKMYNYNTEIMLDNFKIDTSYLKDKTIYQDRSINIYGISNANYKKLCEVNNIKQEKNQALIINGEYIDDNEKKTDHVFTKMDKNFIQSMYYKEVDYDDDGNELETSHVDFPTFDDIELINNDYYHFSSYYHIVAVVPIDYLLSIDLPYVQNVTFQIQTDEHKEIANALDMMGFTPNDIAEDQQSQREFFMIVEIFIYGFVIVMIVFSFLNILNMMSASIEKRKKEFGMMLSVGMSNKGIHKMILFECLLYGVKTLLYSIPLSVIIEVYMFDIGYGAASDLTFTPSYMAYFVSFIVIVLIMISTFELGLSRFKKQNIIETLKDDM